MAYQINASDLVYDFICDRIKSSEWKPGSRIWTERELSEHLGVSKIAVRSAVGMLVAAGVLRRRQGSGTYVEENAGGAVIMQSPAYTPGIKDLVEIMQFRLYFEVSNVEMFIQNAQEEDYAALQAIHEEMLACKPDSRPFNKLDFDFHKRLAKGTHNSYVIQIYDLINDALHANMQLLHSAIGPGSALEFHPLILKYIQKRDSEIAPLLMRRHMENALEEIEKYRNQSKR